MHFLRNLFGHVIFFLYLCGLNCRIRVRPPPVYEEIKPFANSSALPLGMGFEELKTSSFFGSN